MARNGVTGEQVAHVAEELEKAGKPVTVNTVRSALGETGSYTTISKYLRGWRQQRGDAVLPKAVERSAIGLLAGIWRALNRSVGRRNDQRLAEVEKALRRNEKEIKKLRVELEESERAVAALEAELGKIRGNVESE